MNNTDPHNSYDSEEQPYREILNLKIMKASPDLYEDYEPTKKDLESNSNTTYKFWKLLLRFLALVALVFSVLFAFQIL